MADGLRFLLDENQRLETAAFLRNLGYDVETAQEAALSAAPDSRIAAHAKKTGRVIITFNYDFADMTQVFPHDVPGIIRLRVEPQILTHGFALIARCPRKINQAPSRGRAMDSDQNL
ncbi:MAG: DUF5615 family PIN-like protein [Nitrospirae bacterium]|nr:DUF5615 family PIN-like protein [Nitrospirota bacterium]